MRWDEVLDTITMTRWHAYETEWLRAPHIDDIGAWFVGYEPPTAKSKMPVDQKQPNFDEFFGEQMAEMRRIREQNARRV